ncbi:PPPDE putative peptidase domain-containing protein [Rhizoctonia solani]|nr:PPPDE putative peptidase domain-containing protein [Rhizoctonia solani]
MSLVQLYVYDLSGGLAKALSMQMTGKQIDGIWHTSVVVFGKEIFYGQGISITAPGRSHHGRPLQIIEFGETAIDEETFNEYLNEIRENYTADKYHLLDFNCNSFTNDVIGFLTGQHIPAWIRDLPADFLSTPFGASLRPTIDNMFRRPTPGATPPPGTPQTAAPAPDISNLLLQAVAQRAAASTSGQPITANPASSTVAAPVHIATNPPSLDSLIKSHRASVVFFTSSSCGPCRMVEPAFEDLAREKAGPDVVFVKVSLDVPGAAEVSGRWEVHVTPTFIMCLDGERTDELKGADRGELKTRVDLLLYQAFPPHPHLSLNLPALKALSTQATVYEQAPDPTKLLTKLQTTITSLGLTNYSSVAAMVNTTRAQGVDSIDDQVALNFAKASDAFITAAPPQDLFPLLDLWRIALLNQNFVTKCALGNYGLSSVITKVSEHIEKLGAETPKALALTGLRLQSNISANSALLRHLIGQRAHRSSFTQVAVSGLLHEDTGVRTAAATLVFNLGTHLQRSRRQNPTRPDSVEDGDWEVEVLTAILESLSRESDPGIVHRLVSAFGFFAMLSPTFLEQTGPLLEVLEAKTTLDAVASTSKVAEVTKLARECILLCDTPNSGA